MNSFFYLLVCIEIIELSDKVHTLTHTHTQFYEDDNKDRKNKKLSFKTYIKLSVGENLYLWPLNIIKGHKQNENEKESKVKTVEMCKKTKRHESKEWWRNGKK